MVGTRRRTGCLALLLGALCVAGCSRGVGPLLGRGEPAYVQGLDVRLRAEVRAGPVIGGFVQTPIGGAPGTTSPKRPTFDELDVDTVWAPSTDLRFAFGRHRIHVGGTYWVLHGQDTLRDELISHGDTYPAGTLVTSDTEFLSTWLGYGYAIPLGSTPGRLTLTPGIGVYAQVQYYDIHGGGLDSAREFSAPSPMLDAELIWHPGGRIHVSGEVRLVLDEALGLSSPTTVVEVAARLHLDLWRDANLYLGVGYSYMEHFDEQTVPNYSEIEVAPWFALGCEFRF